MVAMKILGTACDVSVLRDLEESGVNGLPSQHLDVEVNYSLQVHGKRSRIQLLDLVIGGYM
ncbi:hypothetical protein ANCCAN_26016 [Ancylostoma caninum]|uniref:Uncharacterized protein n=1 Tax=Ancylostoma caninum TaxID=29170 RepID=A0A368F817_ANCCA|nr:hypothetical protein ANCCAN_26016 [Ancylostoma caninum]